MPSYSPAFRKGHERYVPEGEMIALWFGVDVHLDSTLNTWEYLQRKGTIPHFVWNPRKGDFVIGAPLDYTGTIWPGSNAICIAVICDPKDPFTQYPLEGSEFIPKTLTAMGVPEIWPYGPPAFSEHHRAVRGPLKPGHYSADQIDDRYQGIGAIDIAQLFRPRADA